MTVIGKYKSESSSSTYTESCIVDVVQIIPDALVPTVRSPRRVTRIALVKTEKENNYNERSENHYKAPRSRGCEKTGTGDAHFADASDTPAEL